MSIKHIFLKNLQMISMIQLQFYDTIFIFIAIYVIITLLYMNL